MPRIPRSPLGRIIPRRAADSVNAALDDTRVVLVNGARQAGKSTLVSQLAAERDMEWFTLDESAVRAEAHNDDMAFVQRSPRMVIDEIQREPELLLAIKAVVDSDFVPGRFLLTGSARVLGLRRLPDTLAGRMETIELWPLSQGEIDGAPDGFVKVAFDGHEPMRHESDEPKESYVERLVRGGFPEAAAREGGRRGRFLRTYVADLINRDVNQLSEITRSAEMHTLVSLLAARSGGLLVPGSLAGDLRMAQKTVKHYVDLLEEIFLIKRIPAWSRNLSARSNSTPKVSFVDSGVAAAVLHQDERSLRRIGSPVGLLLEGFVAMEIARQLSWTDGEVRMYHYRTKDKIEVDLVLENALGQVVAIEVKSSSTPKAEDFRGIRHLADRLGDDLLAGYVMHTGHRTYSFGAKLKAIPIAAVWEVGEQR